MTIGEWRIEIPGSWRIGNEDRAFFAYRDGNVRVSTWSRDPDVAADEVAPWDEVRLVPGHVLDRIDRPGLRGVLSQRTTEEEGATFEVVSGFLACPGQIALATVVVGSGGLDGALEILRSLRPAEPPEDDPTWAPRPLPAWTRDLIAAGLKQLAAEPGGGWLAIFSVPGEAGYVQASTHDDGTLHTEAAGECHEPRMAEPARLASLLALGWGEASDEDAGNHVRHWPPGSDVRVVAEELARTLDVVYDLGEDRCPDAVLGQ